MVPARALNLITCQLQELTAACMGGGAGRRGVCCAVGSWEVRETKKKKRKVTSFFPWFQLSLYLLFCFVFFSTRRKQQLNWTLPTLLRSGGLLSVVVPLKISKKAR